MDYIVNKTVSGAKSEMLNDMNGMIKLAFYDFFKSHSTTRYILNNFLFNSSLHNLKLG